MTVSDENRKYLLRALRSCRATVTSTQHALYRSHLSEPVQAVLRVELRRLRAFEIEVLRALRSVDGAMQRDAEVAS